MACLPLGFAVTQAEVAAPTAGALPRIAAAVVDLGVIAAWAVFAGLLGWAARLVFSIESASGWDLFAFVALVMPVVVTFVLQEASSHQATLGKRQVGLIVTYRGARLGWRRSLLRSAVKFAPWQMGHTAVFHLGAGSEATGYVAVAIAAQVIVLTSALVMTFDRYHRAFHDLVAGTRVV